ncbi:hypothetical protein [Caudoviricetes sp.]|nr:hypothetical protein [Caudoviricetes sp.]
MQTELGILGASNVVNGVVLWQFNIPVGNDNDDVEPSGEVDVFQSLGVSAVAYPKTEEGYAEGVGIRDCGGKALVCIGARDTRNAKLVGKMSAGDTTLHSTGPGSVAQCFLKHQKKQAGLATDDADGKSMMLLLDGKNKKVQLAARGAMVQIDEKGDISIVNKSGAGILIAGKKITLLGELSLPGMTPGMSLVQALPAPQGPGPLTNPLSPVLGVSK